ncbi:flagellar hook-length control protein FliK, partial [Oharaeibacter diazotrophicus]
LDAAERAAGRILLHQAASIGGDDAAPGTDDDAPRGLVFEIPIAGPAGVSVAEVRIERDDHGGRERGGADDDGGPVHRVEMAFAVAPLGPVAVRVGLLPGRRVVIGVWCETPAAVARLEAEAAPLADALTAAGLAVSGVDLHLGRPPQRPAAPTPTAPRHRLDVEL